MVLRRPFSGVENTVADQAEALVALRDEDFRFTLLWPRSLPGAPPSPTDGNQVERCGPFPASRALRMLWEQCALPARLRRCGAAVYHAPAYLAPLAAPCPVVLTVYDLHALDQPDRCRTLNRWNYRIWMPRSIRKAARIIVPSDHTREALVRHFPSVSGRVRVIPLAIHRRFQPSASLAAPALPGLPRSYLLCVGNVEPRKNLAVAVEALALLRKGPFPDLVLVVAGCETMGDPAFEAAIRAHGLQDVVVRTGFVSGDLLPRLYAGAEAFVFPSEDEGFGLPPLEAMACGCPVLCSEATALRQTAGTAARFFPPRSADALADAAHALLASPAERAEWVGRGLRHAAVFQGPHLVRRIVSVYAEAADPA